MHGVPRPYDAYLAEGEAATTRGFGGEAAALSRQVLLFNVWESSPPLDVPPLPKPNPGLSLRLPPPTDLAAEPAAASANGSEDERVAAPRCRAMGDWRDAARVDVRPRLWVWPPAAASAVPLQVSLLGPAWRRGYRSRVFLVRAPPGVRAALCAEDAHSVVHLDGLTGVLVRAARLAWRLSTPREAAMAPLSDSDADPG